MEKIFHKFLIPVKPDSINKVCSYGKKDGDVMNMKLKWEKIARNYLRRAIAANELPIKFEGKIGVHFKLFFELERERDGDNYTLMCKGILDAFVKEGMIPDDNYKYVDDNGRRINIDRDQSRVEVHIIEKIKGGNFININYGQQRTIQGGQLGTSIIGQCEDRGSERSAEGLADQTGQYSDASESAPAEQAHNDG